MVNRIFQIGRRTTGWLVFLIAASAGVIVPIDDANAATMTVRLRPGGRYCENGGCGHLTPEGDLEIGGWIGSCSFYFTDPLPADAVLHSMSARALMISSGKTVYTVTTELNQEQLGTIVVDALFAGCDNSGTYGRYEVESERYDTGLPGYAYGALNRFDFNYTEPRAAFVDAGYVDVTFDYGAPSRIEFDASAESPDEDRRILIHKFGDSDSYFSPHQSQDGKFKISGYVKEGDAPQPNVRVYLRVIDPPDVAAYVPAAERIFGDNHDRAAGVLDEAEVVSDDSGRFSTLLEITDRVAGDNYQIEASTKPFATSVCDVTNNCYRSGVLTAWKRIYVETDVMAREGSFITRDSLAPQGAGDPGNVVYAQEKVKPGATVALIHAPRNDGKGGTEFYGEIRRVVEAKRDAVAASGERGWQLILDRPLSFSYYGADSDAAGNAAAYLADAVAVIDAQEPFFRPNLSFLQAIYAEAFVDYVLLPIRTTFSVIQRDGDPVSIVPFVKKTSATGVPHTDFAQKWFFHRGKPNHHHLIGANVDENRDHRGLTYTGPADLSWTYVYVGKVQGQITSTADLRLNGEIVVHEIAHQWHSNESEGGHCDHRNWQDTGSCTQIYALDVEVPAEGTTRPCGSTICPEYVDGKVSFHYLTGRRSEFTWIRERPDPKPLRRGVPNP